MNFIQVRNVSHGYTAGGFFSKRHKVQVLKGLDLDLQAGQSLGLLGSSGSDGFLLRFNAGFNLKFSVGIGGSNNDTTTALATDGTGRVAVVGYCWVGTLAYLAACELPVS